MKKAILGPVEDVQVEGCVLDRAVAPGQFVEGAGRCAVNAFAVCRDPSADGLENLTEGLGTTPSPSGPIFNR